jgi:glycosyltransferase involved in cell wall biosynthesis
VSTAAASLPKVSVVVPVHNGEATIAACVESLVRLDYPSERLEIFVVDNRSTDGTRHIVSRFPVRLLSEDRVQSSYAARNLGVAESSGELLAFTDADCIAHPGWVRALVEALRAPDVGGVAGAIEAFQVRSALERYQASASVRSDRAYAHPVMPFAQTANAAYRRSVFTQIGPFDESLIFGGDLDFSWRMQRETGLRLAYAGDARIWHQHRTTWGRFFRLYEKSMIANCLLARRHPAYYARYTRIRVPLYLLRETTRTTLRAGGELAFGRGWPPPSLPHAVRRAAEAWGWLRWRCGRVALPGESQRRRPSAGGRGEITRAFSAAARTARRP